jgi:hypothetical protein
MGQKSFKHSGTLGDLIYSLPLVKHLGGGEFYLHLGQINGISKNIYNVDPPAFHQGRMNLKDFDFMQSFMQAQPYISKFATLDPRSTEITHNLDRFRLPFASGTGLNYVEYYAQTFGIQDTETQTAMRQTPWLTVPNVKNLGQRDIVINRTQRWIPAQLSHIWQEWKEQGVDQRAIFVGLPQEHAAFQQATGWQVPHVVTPTLLELAETIASSSVFIGNQSVALSVAIGLGHPDVWCEARRDTPIERNECYFPKQAGLHYF